jgi:hypothetical protein
MTIEKYLDGSGHGIIEILCSSRLEELREITKDVRITGCPIETRTEHLPNTARLTCLVRPYPT